MFGFLPPPVRPKRQYIRSAGAGVRAVIAAAGMALAARSVTRYNAL